jgi:eukaryotic-like serine/threonine-protein kinase
LIKDLLPGDPAVVGPYRMLGRLGRGGMGQVYLGRSPGGRRVAVKVIRPELADDAEFRARFAREVAAARGVSGMFTALVIDANTDDEMPWLATAYVPGPSLAEAVATDGPLPVHTLLGLAAGLAEGLQAIHLAGVVHRDLKPSNVLLAADGPRVIDFGISRAREASILTQSGTIVGTPGFLSPEQARGRLVGPPSDVFSLGGVLTYAATGAGPFGSGPTDAMVYRVVELDPELSEVPAELRPIVERCLAKDPAARPTPGELLAELDHLGVDIGVATPEWLPASIADSVARYVPTDQGATVPPPDVATPAAPEAPATPQEVPVAAPTEPPDALAAAGRTTEPSAAGVPAGGLAAIEGGGVTPWARLRNRRRLILAGGAAVVLATGIGIGVALAGGGPGKVIGGSTPSVVVTGRSASATATRAHQPTRSPGAKPTRKPAASHPPTHSATRPANTPSAVAATPPTQNPTVTPAPAPTTQPASPPPTTPAPGSPPPLTPTPTPTAAPPQQISGYSGATPYACSAFGAVGSIPGGTAVSFTFQNKSAADIKVYYLTQSGGPGPGATVGPGSSYAPPSAAAGQAWMVQDAGGSCLGIFRLVSGGAVSVS